MIRLTHVDGEAELAGAILQHAGNVVERVAAVDIRLARTKEVEVRPVERIEQVFAILVPRTNTCDPHTAELAAWRRRGHRGEPPGYPGQGGPISAPAVSTGSSGAMSSTGTESALLAGIELLELRLGRFGGTLGARLRLFGTLGGTFGARDFFGQRRDPRPERPGSNSSAAASRASGSCRAARGNVVTRYSATQGAFERPR